MATAEKILIRLTKASSKISTVIDATYAFNNNNSFYQDLSGWDKAIVEIVNSDSIISFKTTNDNGSVTGEVLPTPEVPDNWVTVLGVNLNNNSDVSSINGTGIVEFGIIGKYLQLSTPAPTPVLNGLQMYLDAGNIDSYPGTGTTWYDLTANNYNANLSSVSFTSVNGGAMVNSHLYSQITVNNIGQFSFSSAPFSVCMWINSSIWDISPYVCQTVIDFETGGWQGWLMRHCAYGTYLGGRQDQQISTTMPDTNTWINLTFTTNGNNFKMYYNTILNYSSSGLNYSGYSYTPYGIGCNGEATGQGFEGLIGVVMVYNIELSEAEVIQNYLATGARFGI